MEERKYRYDAFISYRHTELDKFVAENLIKQLEAYKLPKSVAKKLKGKKTKIERVFRDREELPLTNNLEEPIIEALQSSEWLIVICSPRLPESVWCKKEIETFISLRGREHVLAVLIEGEPSEAFPEELLYKIVDVQLPDGTTEQIKEPVEPLAADFRGKGKKGVAKAMKQEKLRVLASIFGVPYDDLRQRHRERKMHRIVTASVLIGIGCLLFGIYSSLTAMHIKEQKEQIELQSEQILQQSGEIQAKSDEIQKQNVEITKQNEELALRQALALAELATGYYEAGDNKSATKTAMEALTESNGIKLPYTPEAQYVLTDSIRAYDVATVYKAGYQQEMAGKIEFMDISTDRSVLSVKETSGSLILFDLKKGAMIDTVAFWGETLLGETAQVFVAGRQYVFIDSDGAVYVYDIDAQSVSRKLDCEAVSSLYSDREGKYLVVSLIGNTYSVYDTQTWELISTIERPENRAYGLNTMVFSEGIFIDSYNSLDDEGKSNYVLYFWDIESGQQISTCEMGEKTLIDMRFRDGVAYALFAHYQNTYLDCDSYVAAISIENGNILWENKIQGGYAHKILLPGLEDATQLICATSGAARMMDMKTGEITYVANLVSNVLEIYGFANNNDYLLFLENGDMVMIAWEHRTLVNTNNRLECKSSNNVEVFYSTYGIVIREKNDNKFTVYTAEKGPGVKEISEEIEHPVLPEEFVGEAAREIVRSYGLERPEYVYSVYHSADEKICIIHYWDGKLVIFDTVQKKVLNTIENAYITDWYLGTDIHGYTYIMGYDGCYVLDGNMAPIAWINEVKNVNLEKGIVYIESGIMKFETPIFTLEELLEIAENKQ